jgi:chromosome partitioning protein
LSAEIVLHDVVADGRRCGGQLLSFLDKLAGGVLRGHGWLRSPPLLKGCITIAALVAAADPGVSLARRATVDRIFDELRGQKSIDLALAAEAFQNGLLRLQSGGSAARSAALANLTRLTEDRAAVELLLRIAQLVALADGEASAAVRIVVAEIAGALGVSPPSLEVRPARSASMPDRVIVVGNEKGGTGKSTTAIHIALGLTERGAKVACIDLDSRQATLSRFLANRAVAAAAAGQRGQRLVVPRYCRAETADIGGAGEAAAETWLHAMLSQFADHDVVVIDTPGFATAIAQLAHGAAQVLVTPINDSFIDIDALADIDVTRREVLAPSPYSSFVWQLRDRRTIAGESEFDWIVVRNRIGQLDSRNARDMAALLAVLSARLEFRLQPGFSERVVYRELFFRGLTLLDLSADQLPHGSRASFARAREEVEELVDAVLTAAGRSTTVRTD